MTIEKPILVRQITTDQEKSSGWATPVKPLAIGFLGIATLASSCTVPPSAATPELVAAPTAVEGTCAPDNLEHQPLTDEETPLLIIDSSHPVDTSQWEVVAGEFIRPEASQSETANTIYLVAISDTAAQQLIGNPQIEETLRLLGASIQALGARIAVGSQYSLVFIPIAGHFIAITHPEVGQLQAQADCVWTRLFVNATRQALHLDPAYHSAFADCGYPPVSTPTPTLDDGRVNASRNQLHEGKIKLGLGNVPDADLTREQKILAMEAACPAGGIRERLLHLEGRDGFIARNLQDQGYSDKDIYFFIIYNIPLPSLP